MDDKSIFYILAQIISFSLLDILEYINGAIDFIAKGMLPKDSTDKLISWFLRNCAGKDLLIPTDILLIIADYYDFKECGMFEKQTPFQFDLCFALGPETDYIGDIQAKLDKNKFNNTKIIRNKDVTFTSLDYQSLLRRLIIQQKGDLSSSSKCVSRKRFISMIDKRNDNNDIIYMYNPPKDVYTSDIPDPQPSLWGMSSSCTCLLPSMDYDKIRESDGDVYAGCPATNLLTFSFQIKSVNERKCYLWRKREMIRIFPNEIETILSKMFNMDYGNNRDYLKSNDFKNKLDNMNRKVGDEKFDGFLKSCNL